MVPGEDPFDTVRSQVSKTISSAERQHTKWGEARRRKPIRHDECKLLLAELLSSLEAVEADLGDLEEVLSVVEASRSRFPHLDDAEVASRQNFVRSSQRIALSIREDVATHAPKSARVTGSGNRGRGEERQGLLSSADGSLTPPSSRGTGAGGCVGSGSSSSTGGAGGNGGNGGNGSAPAGARAARESELDAVADHNAGLMEMGQAQQQAQLHLQDETLEQLGSAVRRIKDMGMEMNDELSTQKRMLNELESATDAASEAMRSMKDKMKKMASSKDRGKFCAIIVLTVALWGLTCLVLYT